MDSDAGQPSEADTAFVDCPRCAEHIRPRAVACRFCGYDLVNRTPAPVTSRTVVVTAPPAGAGGARKSPVVAALLSIALPGLGHFYVGRVGTGIGFLVSSLVTFVIMSLLRDLSKHTVRDSSGLALVAAAVLIGICIASIVSAARSADRANKRAT